MLTEAVYGFMGVDTFIWLPHALPCKACGSQMNIGSSARIDNHPSNPYACDRKHKDLMDGRSGGSPTERA